MRAERVKVGREPHLDERGGSEREDGEERVDSTVNEGRFQGGERGRLPRGSRRKHERVSGCKSSPGRSAESWFHSKSGQT